MPSTIVAFDNITILKKHLNEAATETLRQSAVCNSTGESYINEESGSHGILNLNWETRSAEMKYS